LHCEARIVTTWEGLFRDLRELGVLAVRCTPSLLLQEELSFVYLSSKFSCFRAGAERSRKKHKPNQRAPSSSEIRWLIEQLGLPVVIEIIIYELIVYIPATREELKERIKVYSRFSSSFPPINSWDVSKITDLHALFLGCTTFNEYIGGWDVSQATNMSHMFHDCCNFNQSLAGWDVSRVTSMSYTFFNCTSFDQSLSDWNVSLVTDMSHMFTNCSSFNQSLANWDVSSVTNMNLMFYRCLCFNQSLSKWNMSRVTSMVRMFERCASFNQSLADWHMSQKTDMSYMFYGCRNFDHKLHHPSVDEE